MRIVLVTVPLATESSVNHAPRVHVVDGVLAVRCQREHTGVTPSVTVNDGSGP